CSQKGQADLIYRQGAFYLLVTIDIPTPPQTEPTDVLGVDLGIVNLAVDSDGEIHTGEQVKKVRRRYHKLRQGLQQANTRSSRKHLRRIRRKESRFQRWLNHNLSKHLVQKASEGQKALALEDLKGIRERATVQKSLRYERLSWAFHQLRQFLA